MILVMAAGIVSCRHFRLKILKFSLGQDFSSGFRVRGNHFLQLCICKNTNAQETITLVSLLCGSAFLLIVNYLSVVGPRLLKHSVQYPLISVGPHGRLIASSSGSLRFHLHRSGLLYLFVYFGFYKSRGSPKFFLCFSLNFPQSYCEFFQPPLIFNNV